MKVTLEKFEGGFFTSKSEPESEKDIKDNADLYSQYLSLNEKGGCEDAYMSLEDNGTLNWTAGPWGQVKDFVNNRN